MKKKNLRFFGAFTIICTFVVFNSAFGQAPTATINLPQTSLVPGTTFQVPVKLNGTNVGNWRFIIRYNRNTVSYQSVSPWSGLNFPNGFFLCNGNFFHDSIPGDTLINAGFAYAKGEPGMNYNNQIVFTLTFLYKGGGTINMNWAHISTGKEKNYQTSILANPYTVVNVNATYNYTYAPLTAGSVAASQSICYNNAPLLLTGTPPTGGVSPYTYQWQLSSDNISFVNIPGATGLNYQPGQLTANTWYRQVQTSSAGVGSVTTTSLAITVGAPPPACPDIPTVTYGGLTYHTVQIGNQCWLKENLNIGKLIDVETLQTDNDTIEKYCYDSLESNCAVYGGLYQWDEMMQYTASEGARGICPEGWHIPSASELNDLATFLGGPGIAGGPMKEFGMSHWNTPNSGGTNCSGFTALAGGYSDGQAGFNDLLNTAIFWTSNMNTDTTAWSRSLFYTGTAVVPNADLKNLGFSVRCIYNGIPVNKTIENVTVPQGQNICYNALQIITVAGNGTTFLVQNGGSVTLIAGEKILFLPGASAEQGGFLHGYIAPGGPFCQTTPVPAVKTTVENEQMPGFNSSFRVYPNPTDDQFTIEWVNKAKPGKGTLEIFNTNGQLLQKAELNGSAGQHFSLSGNLAGVYYVRVITDTSSEIIRIIKL